MSATLFLARVPRSPFASTAQPAHTVLEVVYRSPLLPIQQRGFCWADLRNRRLTGLVEPIFWTPQGAAGTRLPMRLPWVAYTAMSDDNRMKLVSVSCLRGLGPCRLE